MPTDATRLGTAIRDDAAAATGGTPHPLMLAFWIAVAGAIKLEFDTHFSGGGGGGGIPTSYLDTDVTLAANSDAKIATQKATKAYVDDARADASADLASAVSTIGTALAGKLDANAPITGSTKTKITYDADGLVTSGADATTADIADSAGRRYVVDADLVKLANLSGTNSGDQTITLSGDVSGSGTGAITATIGNGAVTYAKMQDVSAAARVIGRAAGSGAGDPEEITASQVLDMLGTTRGAILYRGASGWAELVPGTAGHVLTSGGSGADPSFQAIASAGTAVNIAHAAMPASVNLTTEGTIDWWAHGASNPYTPLSQGPGTTFTQWKARGGRHIITGFGWVYGGNTLGVGNATTTCTFTSTQADTAGPAAANTTARGFVSTTPAITGFGFTLRVPASATTRTLRIYWSNGGHDAVEVAAYLVGAGTSAAVDSTTTSGTLVHVMSTITFNSAFPGDELVVTVLVKTKSAAISSTLGISAVTLA